MMNNQRKSVMESLRKNGATFREIGEMFGITGVRVSKILHYVPRPRPVHPCYHCGTKTECSRRSILPYVFCTPCLVTFFTSSTGKRIEGREWGRQVIRMRLGHRCVRCQKVWKPGMRRLDIHHLRDCGKKSRGYDHPDTTHVTVLCHRCHLGLHSVRQRMRTSSSPRAQRALSNLQHAQWRRRTGRMNPTLPYVPRKFGSRRKG